MPLYTLVGGPCDGQTMELDLDNLERMNWSVDVPAMQDVEVSIWGSVTGGIYTLPVTATYRLDDGANSVRLQFVSSRSTYTIQQRAVWEVVQQEMNRRQIDGLLNPVFHRERVPVPSTMADSVSGVRRYAPGPVTISAATHAPRSGLAAGYVWSTGVPQSDSGGE